MESTTHNDYQRPLRIINSRAPIRICDNGGWTDTWFAQHGQIFNIGVSPAAEVQIQVYPFNGRDPRIVLYAENFGDRYVVNPERDVWDRHPLLEAAIWRMKVPENISIQVTVFSEAPAGASTGTSAAVAVALVGALDHLTPGQLSAHQVAYTAHSIEVDMLKRQSGIQDQLCSAYGGINYIEMFKYPHASVSQLHVPAPLWWEMERRLALIYLGRSHDSSRVHDKVIRGLESAGPDCVQLEDLRATAARSRDAVYAGDFAALGRAMVENTQAQGRLHPDLISQDAWRVIEIAKQHGASGWKVNGAGGEGGSITLLCSAQSHVKRAMLQAIEQESQLYKNIPIHLSRYGLQVWEGEGTH